MTTINIYSKEQVDALLAGKQGTLTASDGVAITNGNIAHTNAVTPQTTGAGSATQIPVFTYDAQGHITGVTPTTVNATNDVDGNAIKTTYMKVADFHTIGGNYGSDNPVTTQYFVNSSIATNTANFIGTYDVVTDLGLTTSATTAQVETALGTYMTSHSITPTNNDYAFVYYDLATDPGNVDRYERYKYSASGTPGWAYEYTLNNSSFTAVQWEAINSGINSTKVSAYDAYATSKQDTLVVGTNMDSAPTSGSNYPVTSGGVYSAINNLDGNVVHLTGNENIGGIKTFTGRELHITGAYSPELDFYHPDAPSSSVGYAAYMRAKVFGGNVPTFDFEDSSSSAQAWARFRLYDISGANPMSLTMYNDGTTSYVTTSYRTTNLSNYDIITKGNLEGSNHTFTGINTFTQYATFYGAPWKNTTFRVSDIPNLASTQFTRMVECGYVNGTTRDSAFAFVESQISSTQQSVVLSVRTARNGAFTSVYRYIGVIYDEPNNVAYARTNSVRGSTNKSDYGDDEIVTIGTLKKLGLI